MKLSTLSKYDIALHGVPTCAVCNKPVEKMESWYDPMSMKKVFRVFFSLRGFGGAAAAAASESEGNTTG